MQSDNFTTPHCLHRAGYHWQVQVQSNSVIIHYGKGLTPSGRKLLKKFASNAEAVSWTADALAAKSQAGYKYVPLLPTSQNASSNNPRRSSRKRTPVVKLDPEPWVVYKRTKRFNKRSKTTFIGKTVHPSPFLPPAGVVDPPSGLKGMIYSEMVQQDRVVYDVMLVKIDTAKHTDFFTVLQLVHIKLCSHDHHQNYGDFVVYERSGCTGTLGEISSETYPKSGLNNAIEDFEERFWQKTGLSWQDRDEDPVKSKYRVVKQDPIEKCRRFTETTALYYPRWQYWVDDHVDGKSTDWYDYDSSGNTIVEQLYSESLHNQWLSQRVVKSGTFSYLVNLTSMTQENVVHSNHTVRHIRRVPPGEAPDDIPPAFAASVIVGAVQTTINTKAKKPNVLRPIKKSPSGSNPVPRAIVPKSDTVESEQVEIPVDSQKPKAEKFCVVDDFDAMLNRSDITDGRNNNKYYKLQLLQDVKNLRYFVWMRWGRVGESRGTQTMTKGPFKKLEDAERVFAGKFKDKTANKWEDREQFEAVTGKYEMLEMDYTTKQEENPEPLIMPLKKAEDVEYLPCTLPKETKALVELLFEKDVYTDAMKAFDIDVRRMPLGNLSSSQIQKGVAILEEIEEALKIPSLQSAQLARLSSKFYTTLPHDFGRRRPPIISNAQMLQNSYDMCNVLLDMETANSLMEKAEAKEEDQVRKQLPHPVDSQYASLNANLTLVEPDSEEHSLLMQAFERTKGDYSDSELLDIWRVERKGESERFKSVKLANHTLLWHGSHIGAISAILSTGLRIMPHSGGRVGRGIYLASENGKSQQYTTPACKNRIGCMFLAEAALGKSCQIFKDNSSLTKAPHGFDSVLACGQQTPGFKRLDIDGESISIPVDIPKPVAKAARSSFYQDEYLVYNEAQVRLRYVLTVKKKY